MVWWDWLILGAEVNPQNPSGYGSRPWLRLAGFHIKIVCCSILMEDHSWHGPTDRKPVPGIMCPQSRREGHAHATAVADTGVQSWIVVVNLQCIEARSVANGNTSAKRGEFNSWKNAGSFLAKRIQKCPWESSLVEKWKVPTKPPVNFPNENKQFVGKVDKKNCRGSSLKNTNKHEFS